MRQEMNKNPSGPINKEMITLQNKEKIKGKIY